MKMSQLFCVLFFSEFVDSNFKYPVWPNNYVKNQCCQNFNVVINFNVVMLEQEYCLDLTSSKKDYPSISFYKKSNVTLVVGLGQVWLGQDIYYVPFVQASLSYNAYVVILNATYLATLKRRVCYQEVIQFYKQKNTTLSFFV